MKKLYKFLLWCTNNEENPKHEAEFDVVGFLISTTVLIWGLYLLVSKKDWIWIPFLVIEYLWYVDNMRHNRNY